MTLLYYLLLFSPNVNSAFPFDNNYKDEDTIKNSIIQNKKIVHKRDTLKEPQILHRVISAPPSLSSSNLNDMYPDSYSIDSKSYLCSQVTMGRSTSLTTYLHYTLDLDYLPGSCKSIGYTRKRGLRPHRGGEGILIEDFAPDYEGVVQKYKRQEYHKSLDENKFKTDIQRRDDYLHDFDSDSGPIYGPRSRGNRRRDSYLKSSPKNSPDHENIDLKGEIEIDKTTMIDTEKYQYIESNNRDFDSSAFANLMQKTRSVGKTSDQDPRKVMSEIYLN